MKNTETGEEKTQHFYGRSQVAVTDYCKEHYYPLIHYNEFKMTKVGECKYTVKEPVIEFTDEETSQIEAYYVNEAIKFLRAKAIAEGNFEPVSNVTSD